MQLHKNSLSFSHIQIQLSKWQYASINIDFFFFSKIQKKPKKGRRGGEIKGIWGSQVHKILLRALISCACPFCLQICSHCLRTPGCRYRSSGTSCPLVWAPRSGSSGARSWRRRWPVNRSREWWGWSGSGSLGFRAPRWAPAESSPEANGPESAGPWTLCRFACWVENRMILSDKSGLDVTEMLWQINETRQRKYLRNCSYGSYGMSYFASFHAH